MSVKTNNRKKNPKGRPRGKKEKEKLEEILEVLCNEKGWVSEQQIREKTGFSQPTVWRIMKKEIYHPLFETKKGREKNSNLYRISVKYVHICFMQKKMDIKKYVSFLEKRVKTDPLELELEEENTEDIGLSISNMISNAISSMITAELKKGKKLFSALLEDLPEEYTDKIEGRLRRYLIRKYRDDFQDPELLAALNEKDLSKHALIFLMKELFKTLEKVYL